jgi:hypothetical protein
MGIVRTEPKNLQSGGGLVGRAAADGAVYRPELSITLPAPPSCTAQVTA